MRVKATSDSWADVASAYNFSDVVARLTAPPTDCPPAARRRRAAPFSLNNLRLSDASVIFDDLPLGVHHEVTDLSIGVPFVSTLPVYADAFVQPGLSVRVDGTPFSVAGRTKPFKDSLETVLELRLRSLDRRIPAVLAGRDPAVLARLGPVDAGVRRGVRSAERRRAPVDREGPGGPHRRQRPREAQIRPDTARLAGAARDRSGEADVTNQKFAVDEVAIPAWKSTRGAGATGR